MNWPKYKEALKLIPGKNIVEAMDKPLIAGLMIRVSHHILNEAVETDVSGVGGEADMMCVKRCGEVLQIAGSYYDRPQEQLIDALAYLHEYTGLAAGI